jgi:hypothetical protein
MKDVEGWEVSLDILFWLCSLRAQKGREVADCIGWKERIQHKAIYANYYCCSLGSDVVDLCMSMECTSSAVTVSTRLADVWHGFLILGKLRRNCRGQCPLRLEG